MLVLPAQFTPAALPLCLSDGRGLRCTLRRLTQADAQSLLRFFRSHTPDTLYRRYGTERIQMSAERAGKLAGVDQGHDAALALFRFDGESEEIIAVGRYICATDGLQAEMAFVVHEHYRRRGLCTLLLEALRACARAQGLRQLFAQTQEDNFPMLGIFLKAGAIISIIEGTHAIDVQLPVEIVQAKPTKASARGGKKGK